MILCANCETAAATVPMPCDPTVGLCAHCAPLWIERFTCPLHGDDH